MRPLSPPARIVVGTPCVARRLVAACILLALGLSAPVARALTSSNVAYVYSFGTGSNDLGGPGVGSSIFVNAITGAGVPSGGTYTVGSLTVTITNVPVSAIDSAPATALNGFDTVILYQVCDIASHPNTMTAINAFLSGGGKVVIFDGDRCAPPPGVAPANYATFLYPFSTSSPGPEGASGSYSLVETSTLTTGLSVGPQPGDAVGDANTFTTFDPAWCGSIKATNALGNSGFVEAYAHTPAGGLVVYEGEDMWFTYGPNSHLKTVFDNILTQPYHPDGLPCTMPAAGGSCPDTMVVHYAFDDGSSLGKDTSGNAIDGVVGAASAVVGKCGNALRFLPDNNVQEFSTPSSSALNITGAMTGAAWIRVRGQQSTDNNPTCTEGTIFSKGGNYWFQIEKNNNQIVFQNEGSGREVARANVSIPVGVWTEVGFVRGPWDGTSQPIQLYLNCQPVPTVVTDDGVVVNGLHFPASANSNPLMVGNYGFGNDVGACEFNGDIDEIRIYNRALSDPQMLSLCSCPCRDTSICATEDSLTIDTGWDQSANSLIAVGNPDNEWVVVSDPDPSTTEPRPAFVIPTYSAWANPQPMSTWVSSYPTAAHTENGLYQFEYRFCLEDTLGASLQTSVRADDQATVYLNGHNLGTTGPNTFKSSLSPVAIGTTLTSLFKPGENVIRVDLQNLFGVAMGLNLVGSIHGHTPLYHYCCNDSSCAILGTKWNDLNRNGVLDPGEPTLAGWTIVLSNGRTAVTDVFGNYYFMGLVPGTYTVTEQGQTGWTQTAPLSGSHTVTLHMGQIVQNVDFGNGQFSNPGGPLHGVDWYHDAFPFNETVGLPGTVFFDTTTALVKTGRNTAQQTGNALRFDVPGDSLVACACGDSARLDLVFRILPGPGNYRIAAGRTFPTTPGMVLLRDPRDQSLAAVPGDGSFWGQYMANPGQFASGNHFGGTRWDENTWNSARMDSAEYNIFPVAALGNLPGLASCMWSGTYHESDPKYSVLGISKFRCFVLDTTRAAISSPTLNNVRCDGTVPAWLTTVPQGRTGWDGTNITKEYTKIIPDGLLTPGSHVEYFIRRSNVANPLPFTMVPDTNRVSPQYDELSLPGNPCVSVAGGSTDGHRWQQFGVLPDRWKDASFGGPGMACMLYVDGADGHGDETAWVIAADMDGATAPFKYGSHNGWHVSNVGVDPNDPANFVRTHRGQPGTTWDMYGIRAVDDLVSGFAGSLGSRLSNRAGMGFAAGKYARLGPTPEMLRAYYREVYMTTAELEAGLLGPFSDRSQDEIGLLNDFLVTASGSPQPRGLYVAGSGFVQSETATGGSHLNFLTGKLGLSLRDASYPIVSGNGNACADLLETTAIKPTPGIFGVLNGPPHANDVLSRNGAIPEATEAVFYENVAGNGPYVASIFKPSVPLRNWIAYTDGFGIQNVMNRYCASASGQHNYLFDVFPNAFGAVCQVVGNGVNTTEVADAPPLRSELVLRNNPAVGRRAGIRLAVARRDRGEVAIYDLAGRRTRLLRAGVIEAGVHELSWDRSDDSGKRVPAGVYFIRVRLQDSGFVQSKTLILIN